MALTDTLRIETVSADKRHVEATMPIVPEVLDRKSTRLNSSHSAKSRMPSSA